ncbi:unnamed protein product, partial [Staurois parvus]
GAGTCQIRVPAPTSGSVRHGELSQRFGPSPSPRGPLGHFTGPRRLLPVHKVQHASRMRSKKNSCEGTTLHCWFPKVKPAPDS